MRRITQQFRADVVIWACLALFWGNPWAYGLEKFRFYRMGEDDGSVKAGIHL